MRDTKHNIVALFLCLAAAHKKVSAGVNMQVCLSKNNVNAGHRGNGEGSNCSGAQYKFIVPNVKIPYFNGCSGQAF